MACRNAYRKRTKPTTPKNVAAVIPTPTTHKVANRLMFGVDSKMNVQDLLQNNIDLFEWVLRNKIHPVFWGRNITGENALTKEEIKFLHEKGCKIAATYHTSNTKETERQGWLEAKAITECAQNLNIPIGTTIFLEFSDSEHASRDYMKGFATGMLSNSYIPGFKANTDAAFSFDREYSRGLQIDRDLFTSCLIWAVTPSLKEYERVTTTHLVHPDRWMPFAPSGIRRTDIAIWQYGKDCHPIYDDMDKEVTFNVNLVKNDKVIIEKMF